MQKPTATTLPRSSPKGVLRNIAQSQANAPSWFLVGGAGSAMMDSQGPSISKGLPEQETGASDDVSQNSNGRIVFNMFCC